MLEQTGFQLNPVEIQHFKLSSQTKMFQSDHGQSFDGGLKVIDSYGLVFHRFIMYRHWTIICFRDLMKIVDSAIISFGGVR